MAEDTRQNPEELRTMAKGLLDLQQQLEPVRDKALDQKSFYTGYAQCAEAFIKVIVGRVGGLQNQANEIENPTPEVPTAEELIAEKFKNIEISEDNSAGDVTEDSSPE